MNCDSWRIGSPSVGSVGSVTRAQHTAGAPDDGVSRSSSGSWSHGRPMSGPRRQAGRSKTATWDVLADVNGSPRPAGPAVAEAEAGELGHEVELGRPHVPVRRGVADEAPLHVHPVVRPRDLTDEVVERLDAHVAGLHLEHPTDLAGRQPAHLGHGDLDDEAAAGLQVGGGVGEDGDLLALRGHVHDRVEHEVDERERTLDACRRHVADGHRHAVGAGLGPQLVDHVRGQLDAADGDPTGRGAARPPSPSRRPAPAPDRRRRAWRGDPRRGRGPPARTSRPSSRRRPRPRPVPTSRSPRPQPGRRRARAGDGYRPDSRLTAESRRP